MRYLISAALLMSFGCHQPGPYNPVSPTPLTQPAAPVVEPRPVLPPFSVSLTTGDTIIKPGPWRVTLSVQSNVNALLPEPPTTLRFTCAGETSTRPIGTGTITLPCTFPSAGDYTLIAIVLGASGFEASSVLRVSVVKDPPIVVPIFYDLVLSTPSENRMTFSVREITDAKNYQWEFGDDDSETTILPYVFHTYTGGGERQVRVRVVNDKDELLASGSVRGRW